MWGDLIRREFDQVGSTISALGFGGFPRSPEYSRVSVCHIFVTIRKLLTTDLWALATMKNAVKCDM